MVKEESAKAGLNLSIQKNNSMASGPIISEQIGEEKMETVTDYIFLGSKITEDGDCSHETKKIFAPLKKSYDKPRQCNKKQRHHFGYKDLYSKAVIFFCSHVWMSELDHKEDRVGRTDAFKLWCWRSLESPLDCKEIKPVNSKGKQP